MRNQPRVLNIGVWAGFLALLSIGLATQPSVAGASQDSKEELSASAGATIVQRAQSTLAQSVIASVTEPDGKSSGTADHENQDDNSEAKQARRDRKAAERRESERLRAVQEEQQQLVEKEAAQRRALEADPDLVAHRSLVSSHLKIVRKSQDHGAYPEVLAELASSLSKESLRSAIFHELELLRKLSPEKRKQQFTNLLSYYSQKKGGYKTSAFDPQRFLTVTEDSLHAGTYESHALARELTDGMRAYDEHVVVPVLEQMQAELVEKYPGKHILFLGRDMTAGYLWMHQQGILSPDQLHLANISRKVKDAANYGHLDELRRFLKQVGIDQRTAANGLVIIDASKNGRIPAVVVRALCQGLDRKASYQMLKGSHVRYLKSARPGPGGTEFAEAVEQASSSGELSSGKVDDLLRDLSSSLTIAEFDIQLPQGVAKYKGKMNQLFEHRPKPLPSATGFSHDKDGIGLASTSAHEPMERILGILGFHGDIALYANAKKRATLPRGSSCKAK